MRVNDGESFYFLEDYVWDFWDGGKLGLYRGVIVIFGINFVEFCCGFFIFWSLV